MAGVQMALVRKTTYTLSSSEMVLVPLVDVLGWVSATLLWRISSVSGSNPVITLMFRNVMVAGDDPQNTYATASGSDLLNLTLAASTTISSPLLIVGAIGGASLPIGRFVQVSITAASGTPTLTMAVDAVGRDA